MLSIIFYIVVFVALLFWLTQLISVLCRDVEDFESHTHKLVWFLVVLNGSIVGAIWYYVWLPQQKNGQKTK